MTIVMPRWRVPPYDFNSRTERRARSRATVANLEREFVADVAGDETEPVVEAVRVDTGFVGRQLDDGAASLPALPDRPFEHALPKSRSPILRPDPDGLDLATPSTLTSDAGNESDLQAPDHFAAQDRHRCQLVGISLDRSEGFEIFGVRRKAGILSLPPRISSASMAMIAGRSLASARRNMRSFIRGAKFAFGLKNGDLTDA